MTVKALNMDVELDTVYHDPAFVIVVTRGEGYRADRPLYGAVVLRSLGSPIVGPGTNFVTLEQVEEIGEGTDLNGLMLESAKTIRKEG